MFIPEEKKMKMLRMLGFIAMVCVGQRMDCSAGPIWANFNDRVKLEAKKEVDSQKHQKEAQCPVKFNDNATQAIIKLFRTIPIDEKKLLELLKAGANPNALVDDEFILSIALKNNQKKAVLLLQKFGAIPNMCTEDGCSAISYINSIDDAELLLQKPEYLGKDSFGNIPLHHLVGGGRALFGNFDKSAPHASVIPYYIKRGVEKNAMNNRGLTPLMSAVEHGHLDMVIELYKQGVDLDIKNEDERSAADIAKEKFEAETDQEKEDRYHLIWIFLYQAHFHKNAFMNKSYYEILAILKNLKLLNIPIAQTQGKLFLEIWTNAQTKQEKGLAITYLITALADMKKDGKNIEKELVAAKELIQDNIHQLSNFVFERSLERLKTLQE